LPIGRACISVHREAAMAHGPLDSVPEVVSALIGMKASNTRPMRLQTPSMCCALLVAQYSMLRVFRGSADPLLRVCAG
jgi:hypothetical protein